MKCLNCKSDTRVLDSRLQAYNAIKRRRECLECGYRFNTVELSESLVKDLIERRPRNV